jgi:serine/threonine-protein kinase
VSGLTDTNVTLGTVNYAAPEQLTGSAIDGRADQYGLAATAYHLLTGSPMFGSSNPAVVIGRHLNAPPPRLADVRPDLAALDPVLATALSKNPDDRFRTCMDFANALGRAASSGRGRPPVFRDSVPPGPQTPPGPPIPLTPEPAVQRGTSILPTEYPAGVAEPPVHVAAPTSRWPWALAALALVAILGALVFAVWPRESPPPSTAKPTTSMSRSATATSTGATNATTTASTTAGTSASPSAPVTFGAMRDLVTGFYSDLPDNTAGAWEKLDSHYQQRAGQADFLSFWSTIESVSLLSVTPRDATSVVARLRYVLRDGGVDTEDRWLSVVPADGRLLVYDSERIGPA